MIKTYNNYRVLEGLMTCKQNDNVMIDISLALNEEDKVIYLIIIKAFDNNGSEIAKIYCETENVKEVFEFLHRRLNGLD